MLGVLPLGSAPDTAAVNGQARVFVAHEDGATESCAALHCAADVLGCFGEPSELPLPHMHDALATPSLSALPVGLCV